MKKLLFWLAVSVSFVSGQFWAYGVAYVHPFVKEVQVVGQCQQPPEVQRMAALMDAMSLNISVTETGTRPPVTAPRNDQIAKLIGGL